MTNESKIYPSIDDVPRPQTPDMSEAPPTSMPLSEPPPNSMPMHQAATYPMPQSPPNPRPHVGQEPLGPTPYTMTCPSCDSPIVTSVRIEPSTMTHRMALVLCFLCICLTCVPYYVNSCQDVNHYCPNCDAYLGTYKR